MAYIGNPYMIGVYSVGDAKCQMHCTYTPMAACSVKRSEIITTGDKGEEA